MPGRAKRGVAAIAAVAVAVVAAWGYLLATWPPTTAGSQGSSASASERPAGGQASDSASGSGSVSESPSASASQSPSASASASAGSGEGDVLTVVLGDTFTTGIEEEPGPRWPEVLGDQFGWEVETDAVEGSGYLVAGTGTDFTDRVDALVDQEPDVVIVAGGVSDLGRPVEEVRDAADDVVARLTSALPSAEVVVLSPFSNGPPGELTSGLTTVLAEVAAAREVAFVDVSEMLPFGEGLISDDGVHPSEQGHQELGRLIGERLVDLGVAEAAEAAAG